MKNQKETSPSGPLVAQKDERNGEKKAEKEREGEEADEDEWSVEIGLNRARQKGIVAIKECHIAPAWAPAALKVPLTHSCTHTRTHTLFLSLHTYIHTYNICIYTYITPPILTLTFLTICVACWV